MWLVAALAGCGGAGAGRGAVGGTGGGSTSAAAPPCGPSQSLGAVTPTVVLRDADANQVVNAPVGSIVELQLEGLHTWSAPTVAPSGALIKVGAQGVLEQGACLWDFKVARAGDAKIMITEGALCPPNAMCPMYALLVTFTIHGE
ncbi:MAG TPA: hypothetical protein VFN78_12005 [Ktedonobacterales bacterium]|nr:hypothetical protein [Ktedonobacterales bacterium]